MSAIVTKAAAADADAAAAPKKIQNRNKTDVGRISSSDVLFLVRGLAGNANLIYNKEIALVKKSKKIVGETMSNIADLIERYILYRMANEQDPTRVVLKRNEIAEEIACAPSQITYVLGTRFTTERGFQVESRRGSGGFISITRAEEERLVKQVLRRLDESTTREELASWVHALTKRGEMTPREGAMLIAAARYAYAHAEPAARVELIKEMLYPIASS